MAFEEDAFIFNALLRPLIVDTFKPVSKKQRVADKGDTSDESSESDDEAPEIEATNLFCT